MFSIFQKIKNYFYIQKAVSEVKEDSLSKTISLNFLLPPKYQEDFEAIELIRKKQEWMLIIHEKQDNIPKQLQGKDVVLDGFLNPIEIVDHLFKGKLMYLKIYKRRWKEKGTKESYYNEHQLHKKGMKATDEFGDFLKGLTRQERHEFFCAFPNIRHIWEKDF